MTIKRKRVWKPAGCSVILLSGFDDYDDTRCREKKYCGICGVIRIGIR